ncbi:MAG: DUF2490 domain-containing protein [Cytophagales bacterium]
MRSQLIWFLLLLPPASAVAQADLGSWSIFSVKASVGEKWGVFAEGQIRSLKLYSNFHYHEIKGGISYALDKNFSVAIAGGKYDTYRAGGDFITPKASDEFRLFQQLTMSQYLKHIKFEHRYRAEQRFTQNGYRNRLRYRLQAVIPIKAAKVGPKTPYLSMSGELFFTDTPGYFERLRFYFGAGYQLTNTFSLQAGVLHQFDYRLIDETGKNFFQISFLWDIKWHKKEQESVPTNVD